jgi:nitrile hydratase
VLAECAVDGKNNKRKGHEDPDRRTRAALAAAADSTSARVLLVDGIHDLGGMQGFGPVVHSPAERVFPERWQAVARALLQVVAGAAGVSGGEFRHSIERMEPGHYLTSDYYEHWLTAAATLAVEHGLVARSDLEARAGGRFPLSDPVLALPVVDAGPDVGKPRFGAGDRVRVREWHPPGHTRCPRYVRGKAGMVVRVDGTHSVPDIEAHGTARRHEPTYSVRFDAAELWRDAQRGVWVHVDLWDSYLERP